MQDPNAFNVVLIARFEDGMNRQLTCPMTPKDTPEVLVDELIEHRFMNKVGVQQLCVCSVQS